MEKNRKSVIDLTLSNIHTDVRRRWKAILLTLSPRWRLLELQRISQIQTLTAMENRGIINRVRMDKLKFFVRLTNNGCDLRNHYMRREIIKKYREGKEKKEKMEK